MQSQLFSDVQNIIECERVYQKIEVTLKKITDEDGRITQLKKLKEAKLDRQIELENELKKFKSDLANLEKEIFKFQSLIDKNKSHASAVKDNETYQSLLSEEEKLKTQLDQLETQYLVDLEKNGPLNKELSELNKFFQGIDKSIAEIQLEVDQKKMDEKKNIENYQGHLDVLMKELLPSNLTLYKSLKEKFHSGRSVFSYIDNDCCTQCRMKLNKVFQAEVSKTSKIQTCPYCQRLVFPSRVQS